MAEYIASGTSATDGADFTLADGVTASLNLFSAAGVPNGSQAVVSIKTSNSQYIPIGGLDSARPAVILSGPGTFRVSRLVAATAFGVDKS